MTDLFTKKLSLVSKQEYYKFPVYSSLRTQLEKKLKIKATRKKMGNSENHNTCIYSLKSKIKS